MLFFEHSGIPDRGKDDFKDHRTAAATQTLTVADSIIAATALLRNTPVLTNNVVDFADIDGLQVIELADIMDG